MTKYVVVLFLSVLHFSAFAGIKKEQLPFIYYVSIPVVTPQGSYHVSGQYRLPRNVEAPMPAVILLHSSGGVDSTGKFYAKKLNKRGIATLELDMWGARGLLGGTSGRPETIQETMPDAYAALDYLAAKAEIDADKIGVLGFSWGGVVSLLSATEQYNQIFQSNNRFAAHIAHYPVCWVYNNVPGFEFANLTGSPVLIQAAELDDYDLPDTCPNFVNALGESDRDLVDLNMYQGAFHTWDRLEPPLLVEDPFAHLGQGGEVRLVGDRYFAKKSRRQVVKFFEAAFSRDFKAYISDVDSDDDDD